MENVAPMPFPRLGGRYIRSHGLIRAIRSTYSNPEDRAAWSRQIVDEVEAQAALDPSRLISLLRPRCLIFPAWQRWHCSSMEPTPT